MNLMGMFGDSRGVYRMPNGKQAAYYASFVQRFAATVTDWLIAGWVPFFFVGLFSSFVWGGGGGKVAGNINLAGLFWLGIVTTCVLGYFTYFGGNGRTVGMRIVGTRVIEPLHGGPPGYGRAFRRAIFTYIFGASVFILVNYMLSNTGKPNAASSGAIAILVVAFLVFLAGMWAHIYMLFDPHGQTVPDRINGILVIQKPVDLPEDLDSYIERLEQRREEARVAQSMRGRRRRVWIGELKRAEAERARRADQSLIEGNGNPGERLEPAIEATSRPRRGLSPDIDNPRAPGKSRGNRRRS